MITRYVALGIGAWYVLAPFLWGYPMGFLWWNDVVIGAAVGALAASYLVDWNRIGGWALMAVGYYSMLAPFLFGYLKQPFAFWNDLVFGVVTVGCGAMLAAAGITWEPSAREAGAGA